MVEYFFECNKIRSVITNQSFYTPANLEYFLVCVVVLGPNRPGCDTVLFIDYAVTGSGDPRVNADKLQPVSEEIFSITSSEMSKLA